MMPDIDIAVWTHRKGPWIAKALGSVARHCHFSHNIIVVCEPGDVGQNMQRVLDRGKSRFLFLLEDDAQIVDPFLIPYLRETLIEMKHVAMIYPIHCRTKKEKIEWENQHADTPPTIDPEKRILKNTAAAVCMIDREKVPDLYIEQGYVDKKYWKDTDLCLQAVGKGFMCLRDENVRVYHELRDKTAVADKAAYKQLCDKWGLEWGFSDTEIPSILEPEPILRN